MKTVTCQYCKVKEPHTEKENMVKYIKVSRPSYYHKACYEKLTQEKEKERMFIEQENKEREKLQQTIIEIHELTDFPNDLYWRIEDIRNGVKRFQKGQKKKKYKEGFKYSVIEEAYNMSRKKISWARRNKGFKEIQKECNYCLTIVSNKLMDAEKRIKEREREEEMFQMKKRNSLFKEMEEQPIYNKKKSNNDISEFLD